MTKADLDILNTLFLRNLCGSTMRLNTRRPCPLPLPAHILDLNLSQPLSSASALHAETLENGFFC